jgi:hypothetical protein
MISPALPHLPAGPNPRGLFSNAKTRMQRLDCANLRGRQPSLLLSLSHVLLLPGLGAARRGAASFRAPPCHIYHFSVDIPPRRAPPKQKRGFGMEWNGMESNRMEWNRMELSFQRCRFGLAVDRLMTRRPTSALLYAFPAGLAHPSAPGSRDRCRSAVGPAADLPANAPKRPKTRGRSRGRPLASRHNGEETSHPWTYPLLLISVSAPHADPTSGLPCLGPGASS